MAQRDGEATDGSARQRGEAARPTFDAPASPPAYEASGNPATDAVRPRFDAPPASGGAQSAAAFSAADRERHDAPVAATVIPLARTPAVGRPVSPADLRNGLSGGGADARSLRGSVRPPASARPAVAQSVASRAVWRHRGEGAVAMGLVVLAAFGAGWLHGALAPAPAPLEPPVMAQAAETAAALAEDSLLALAESARVAAIAAADPSYRVVLHVEDGVAARDLARLDTAIRAWGFQQPERVVAAESVPLPEVRFFDEGDREAALTLGGVAERLLGEAAVTPPSRSAEPAAPLAGLAAPDASPEPGAETEPPVPARVLELHVPARASALAAN